MGEGLDAVDKRLNRIGMGYMGVRDNSPHAPVSWVTEEHDFWHPFSLKKIARDYAYNKLKDFMTLDTYLNLPADMLDDLMDGLRIGEADYVKDHPPPKDETTQLMEELNKTLNK